MKSKFLIQLSSILISSLTVSLAAFAGPIQVATTTPDLASLVQKVGGESVAVFSLSKGTQDPHHLEAKPSLMVKLRTVDLVVSQGLELESAWLSPLIQGSRNPGLNTPRGQLEIGPAIDPIEVKGPNLSRAEGDVHPGGNPHFQLDPLRMALAGKQIAARLGELRPEKKSEFELRAEQLQKQLQDKTEEWKKRIDKTGLREIVTYHKTFSYFCSRFGLICSLQIEPKPGIPPSASHLLTVIDEIKKRKVKLVWIENIYDDVAAKKLQSAIPGLKVDSVPVSVGGAPQTEDTLQLIEKLVTSVESSQP